MKLRTIIERKAQEGYSVDEAEEDLSSFVMQTIGMPVDLCAVAVLLETNGVRDTDVRAAFGKKDVFELADEIYKRCRRVVTT